jgi:IclR family transcriptional regulator, acetate operon repressor
MKSDSTTRNSTQTSVDRGVLDRFLDVMEAIVAGAPETSLEEIAGLTSLPKPTAHRILAGLSRRGYVVALGRGLYAPGAQLLMLLGRAHSSLGYPRVARPYLLRLQHVAHRTIHFGLLVGGEVVYIDKLEKDRPDRMASVVGMRLPLHSTAIGKVILAHLPVATRESMLDVAPLTQFTVHTITDRAHLQSEIALIASQGFALDNEENEDGIRCVGAPIFCHRGDVVGAISVTAPAFQLSRAHAEQLAPEVMATAANISEALGAAAPERATA